MIPNRPLITLHSGALGTAPNSLEYLKTAASLEPDIIEVDVRRTRDDRAVLCHDPFIPTEGGEMTLEEFSLEELHRAKPDLVTLRDALIYSKEKGLFLNLDLKSITAADTLIYELELLEESRNIIISGCGPEEISYLRERINDLRVLLNVDDKELDCSDDLYMEKVREIVSRGSRLGCCGLNLNYIHCRPELVNYATVRSLPVMVWTVDEEEDMKRCAQMGVYSITTNRIDLLRKLRSDN